MLYSKPVCEIVVDNFEVSDYLNDSDKSDVYCHGLGMFYYFEKDYERSIKECDKALAINPMHIDAHNNKGNSLYSLRRYDEAIVCYDKALEIDANDAKVWYGKGNSLANLRRYDEAIVCYDKALSISPNNPDVLQNRKKALGLKYWY